MEITDVEKEILAIKERNKRVELDKAWERSSLRIFLLCLITYIVVVIVLFVLKNNNPFLNALIPTLGYFLSTQSLHFIKKKWMEKKGGK
jgi:hypothetical protein